MESLHEVAFIQRFAISKQRDRLLTLLRNQRGRDKLRRELPHQKWMNLAFAVSVTQKVQNHEQLQELLRRYGAPETCWVFSADSRIDNRSMELGSAIRVVFGLDNGTLISCIPGILAYFEGEEPDSRYIFRHA